MPDSDQNQGSQDPTLSQANQEPQLEPSMEADPEMEPETEFLQAPMPAPESPAMAPTPPPPPKAGQAPVPKTFSAPNRMYTVEDKYSTLNKTTRTHDLPVKVDGQTVFQSFDFAPGERKKFPQDYAIWLLRAECFIVRNTKGHQIILRTKPGENPGERTVVVAPHEMVVPISAVLKTYLEQVAVTLPDWEKVLGTDVGHAKRDDLEEFVISKQMADSGNIDIVDAGDQV